MKTIYLVINCARNLAYMEIIVINLRTLQFYYKIDITPPNCGFFFLRRTLHFYKIDIPPPNCGFFLFVFFLFCFVLLCFVMFCYVLFCFLP